LSIKRPKDPQQKKKLLLSSSLLSSEGISDVELKRQKITEKKATIIAITPEEREELKKQMTTGVSIKPHVKDILAFLGLQFLPLVALASAIFVPGIYYYFQTSADIRNLMIILQILGCLLYFYTLIRLLSTITYRIEISKERIRWRNIFWWNEIAHEKGFKLSMKKGFYFYLTKIGGLVQIGIEVFCLKSETLDYWVRAYPLRKTAAERLAKLLTVWLETPEENA